MRPPHTTPRAAMALLGLSGFAHAQSIEPVIPLTAQQIADDQALGPAFTSPGLSPYSRLGQVTRFSNDFNPAFGVVIDTVGRFTDVGEEDGFDAELRLMELNMSGFVDPNMWGYVVAVAEEEELGIEEAAMNYIGFEGNSTLKAGRFFVDFGKLMQTHTEGLRTLERPLPLREFLGEELGGDGLQYDNWFALNDSTPVRFSIGVFGNLLSEHHGEEEGEGGPEAEGESFKDLGDLAFTARLTGLTEIGDQGVLQLGSSWRSSSAFAFVDEANSAEAGDLSNSVVGFDATYSHRSLDGQSGWLLGGEYLLASGDLAAEFDSGSGSLVVQDDSASGFYAFVDYQWNPQWSAGVQYAQIEELENPDETVEEWELYATRHFTQFRRLRAGLINLSPDEGDDETTLYLQFTAFMGSHSHGLNW
jgi:hypothetical protein